jgi:hypothetical protein
MSLSEEEIDTISQAFLQAFLQAILRSSPYQTPHQPSPLGTSQPLTQNIPPTSINSQYVMGKEASIPIQEPSRLKLLPSPPEIFDLEELPVQSAPSSPKCVLIIEQPIFYFEDLPIMDYNTICTDNFHQEAKATEFNYQDQPTPVTDYNTYGFKDSHQESQLSDQSYIVRSYPAMYVKPTTLLATSFSGTSKKQSTTRKE